MRAASVFLALPLTAALLAGGLPPGSAYGATPSSACGSVPVRHRPDVGARSWLTGIAVTSPGNAWAVGQNVTAGGYDGLDYGLIEHWNGRGWAEVPSPNGNVGAWNGNVLSAVAATSAGSAWAVGSIRDLFDHTVTSYTLAEHWDGHRWARVPSPSPSHGYGGQSALTSVASTSRSDAWSMGQTIPRDGLGPPATLAEHWDGHS
ncbi:MAG: hypothetical protein ACR2FU_13340 [Streptosporangiaceae bacterium]